MTVIRKTFSAPAAVFLLLALGSMAPLVLQPGSVAFWPGAQYSDLLISHLPNTLIAHDALFTWHQAPLWNPTILSGTPLAADPLAGLAYAPNWLAVLMPSALTFNLLLILHLAWAGVGLYKLSRAQGVGSIAAYAAGILFAAGTKFATHVALGHVGLVSAVSWTPWVLLAWRELFAEDRGGWIYRSALAGGVLGVTFLADPRWFLPSVLLAVAYGFFTLQSREERLVIGETLRRSVVAVVFILGISACLLMPLAELTQLSTRATITSSELDLFSLTPTDLLGSIVLRSGEPEQFVYFGITGLALSIVGLLQSKRPVRFWAGVALVAVLLTLGSSTPVYGWFQELIPGAGLLRVPARFLFITVLALALLAAEGLQAISEPETGTNSRIRIVLFAFCSMVLILNGALFLTRGFAPAVSTAPFVAGLIALSLVLARSKMIDNRRTFMLAWLFLAAFELFWVDVSILKPRPLADFKTDRGISNLTESVPGEFRILSPSFSVSALQAATYDLQLAEGVSPLQLRSYRDYLARALGFAVGEYSVTLPPVVDGGAALSVNGLNIELLELLNIEQIVRDTPWPATKFVHEEVVDGLYQYRLADARPRAWLEPRGEGEQGWQPVESMSWSPNRIELSTTGPGRLVLSEIYYPGWYVRVDGKMASMVVERGIFRAVDLSAGEHNVEFVFQPWMVFTGWGISLLTVVVLFFVVRRR
jgi:hypothetical protein